MKACSLVAAISSISFAFATPYPAVRTDHGFDLVVRAPIGGESRSGGSVRPEPEGSGRDHLGTAENRPHEENAGTDIAEQSPVYPVPKIEIIMGERPTEPVTALRFNRDDKKVEVYATDKKFKVIVPAIHEYMGTMARLDMRPTFTHESPLQKAKARLRYKLLYFSKARIENRRLQNDARERALGIMTKGVSQQELTEWHNLQYQAGVQARGELGTNGKPLKAGQVKIDYFYSVQGEALEGGVAPHFEAKGFRKIQKGVNNAVGQLNRQTQRIKMMRRKNRDEVVLLGEGQGQQVQGQQVQGQHSGAVQKRDVFTQVNGDNEPGNDFQGNNTDAKASQFRTFLSAFKDTQSSISRVIMPVLERTVSGSNSTEVFLMVWSIWCDLTASQVMVGSPFSMGMHRFDQLEDEYLKNNNVTEDDPGYQDYLSINSVLIDMYQKAWNESMEAANKAGLVTRFATLAANLGSNDTSIMPASFKTVQPPALDTSFFTSWNESKVPADVY